MPSTDEIVVAPGEDDLFGQLRPYLRRCYDSRRTAWHIGQRRLLDYLLVYIADGQGMFELDGVRCDMQPGDLFWVPPDTLHAMRGHAPSMRCPYMHFDLIYQRPRSHWNFHIPDGVIDLRPWRSLLHPPVNHPAIVALRGRIRGHTNSAVGDLIIRASHEMSARGPHTLLHASGMLLQIIALLLRGTWWREHGTQVRPESLARAATMMRDQCDRDISIEQACEIAGLSASQFRSLFGRHFGCSPRQYLRRARIDKARQLMEESSITFTRIAEQCGFATVHSFSRAFRAVTGQSPRQYRHRG
ncbi:MAG: AraC family transcriptional regulator [Phycisphaeraceae bacterium]|nr:AraC family transcriptional regulator [Phycisphaeraceae bacterium]